MYILITVLFIIGSIYCILCFVAECIQRKMERDEVKWNKAMDRMIEREK